MVRGFASFCLVVMRVMASSLLGRKFQPENLTCPKWKLAPGLSPFGSASFQAVNALLIKIGEPETFYGGACFDYENLKAKILGVKYRQAGKAEPLAFDRGEPEPVGEKTAPVQGRYVPQYEHITGILRGGVEAIAAHMQPIWEQASAKVSAVLHLVNIHPSSKLVQKSIRDLSSIFTTRWALLASRFSDSRVSKRGMSLPCWMACPHQLCSKRWNWGIG
jgi:hypothetical protein